MLLVEDDADFRDALVTRLTKRNFNIVPVLSAENALVAIESSDYQIIVADIKLPGMDGMTFLAKIREVDNSIPVILMTGYASLDSAKKAVELNATEYLLKPLENIEELLNPVYKAVNNYELVKRNRQLLDELQEQKKELEQKNIALGELFSQLETEKRRMEDNVFANTNKLLLPTLDKLRKKASSLEMRYVDLLESDLKDITSSFGRNLTTTTYRLTPREVELCKMIKNGLTSKEIAKLLAISVQTAERHRNNIRKKLNIVKQGINLATYLHDLAQPTSPCNLHTHFMPI